MISGSKPESSSSVGLQTGGEYEVFLSFRGPDVRRTFADCLYSSLVRSKIRTFRDEEDLWKGETIGPSLVKAITESKIHIPIFTIGYASSRWCLQELAKMVDCRKTGGEGGKGQQVILPVFYFITPRDVRHPDSGPYKEAFEVHNQSHDPVTISGWKEALKEVGVMKGWHVTETDGQGAVMDEILIEVESHLRDSYALVTDDLVGIDLHVEEVLKLLNLDSASEKIVGIHGIGDAYDGIRIIRERVCRHKLLIVLDDVDERFQFEDILGKLGDFYTDSRFLITTRDARVLELLQECKFFELEEMSHDHSLKLLSKQAFGLDYPPDDYVFLSKEFVRLAAGLPLALKVIGSLLFRTNIRFWEEKLCELKDIPPTKVQERLKISYNELTHNEKQIFLDIAGVTVIFILQVRLGLLFRGH
ncbi:Disease resistance protein L6 [Linum perenne]